MTIEITHKGRLPSEDPFAGSCDHCKTAIRCVRADGTFRDGDPRDQRDTGYLEVPCPVCGGRIHAYPKNAKTTT